MTKAVIAAEAEVLPHHSVTSRRLGCQVDQIDFEAKTCMGTVYLAKLPDHAALLGGRSRDFAVKR